MGLILPLLLFVLVAAILAVGLVLLGQAFGPRRSGRVKEMPYESGMDPIHDARRRFDIRFHLVAIAFLLFDVELLFLYPWAVSVRNPQGLAAATAEGWIAGRAPIIGGVALFFLLLVIGFVYDWRKGVFRWR